MGQGKPVTPTPAVPARKQPAKFSERPGGLALAMVALTIIAVISFVSGLITWATATTVMHLILAALHFLTFTLAIAGVGIIAAVSPRRSIP